jgi:nucleoside-triphosphatase THEP1
MGWYVPKGGAIIKATIIVAIFKMMLSPQAPPPAYVAVFFQGLLGELLFRNRKIYPIACLILAVLSLLESGLQRILMLTIIYGNDLWKVINDFINGLTKQKVTTNYSLLIGGGYVLLHLIMGLIIGWWASVLPKRIKKWSHEEKNNINLIHTGAIAEPPRSKRKERFKRGVLTMWILLIALYIQSYYNIGKPILPSHISLKILLRSVIIVLAWYFIVAPLLKQALHFWLRKKKTKSQQDIQHVLRLLPATQQLIAQCWRRSADKKGWSRMIACSKKVLVSALNPTAAKRVFILAAPIQTGKTSSLMIWSENRDDIFGILTPVVNDQRVFMNVNSREGFAMEAEEGENDVLTVGRFVFSKKSFDKAITIIRDAMNNEGWLVIDEIGPIELRGEGFYDIVKEVLENETIDQAVLLIVREGMIDKVKTFFEIEDAVVINNISELNL